MKRKIITACLLVACLGMVSCDETTNTIGGTLIDDIDKLTVTADTFNVTSETELEGRVIARSATGYLGRMEDPETMSPITANLMSQFHVIANYSLPLQDSIMSRDSANNIIADSCDIRLYYTSFNGDSLSQMKLTAYELSKPVEEGQTFYTDFNPETKQYIRTGGIHENVSYTLTDFSVPDSIRISRGYTRNIRIPLNSVYTDKDGNRYNNYGTYLIRKYQGKDSLAFRDTYRFLHEICPGFYFKTDAGIGSIANIEMAQLNIYFNYKQDGKVKPASTNFVSTEEVLQITNFANDDTRLQQLAAETGHTYLKTPAGLLTKLTLPITGIMTGHDNDTINSAKITLYRENNSSTSSYQFSIPQNVVMLPADSLNSFFANNRLPDNKTSFLATYNRVSNSYTFNNFAGIVNLFARNRLTATSNPNWGKVVIVPVDLQTVTQDNGRERTTRITKVSHELALTSTKLLGNTSGSNNLKVSIIYSRFNGR